jgi:hypothetical protein
VWKALDVEVGQKRKTNCLSNRPSPCSIACWHCASISTIAKNETVPFVSVPGSHRLGRLTTAEAVRAKDELGEVCVEIPRGGAMLMKPLLLHASSKVSIDSMRRVLHFVFAPAELPGSLRWPLRGRPMPRCLDGRRRLIEVYLGEVGRSLE